MSNIDYSKLLFASDLVILPYELEKYKLRGSGIVTEVLSTGKILAATTGSYPGHVAKQCGGITAVRPIEFARSILKAAKSPTIYGALAQKSAIAYNSKNHYLLYWPRCLDAEAE